MRRSARTFVVAVLPVAILLGTAGCASERQAVRTETQGISVRLPPAEAMELGLGSDRQPAPPAPPLSVGEEYRDRWLTLFEVTFSPVEAGALPDGEGDSP